MSFLVAFLIMCFLSTLTITKDVIGLSTSLLSSFAFYYLARSGNRKRLPRIWFNRIVKAIEPISKLFY